MVIIDRLPFAAPGDPVFEARLKAIRKECGNDLDIIIENHSFLDAQGAAGHAAVAIEENAPVFRSQRTHSPRGEDVCAAREQHVGGAVGDEEDRVAVHGGAPGGRGASVTGWTLAPGLEQKKPW